VTSSDRNEPDGERKHVTVLFADVMGSMDMAEERDPEEWRSIMQGFFSILSDEVRRFEGTVDKFTGDGIMAVFGAPIAHEDHAQRACYAALRMLDEVAGYAAELRRRHGLNFSVRIGINSGEVVAGGIGEGDYTAIGHTVGLAQRMEALAEPGRAYLTEAAASLARGYFELEDLGEFEIKGASRPVCVSALTDVGRARSRLDRSRERGFSSFVGRDEEMAILEAALEGARAGEGSAIGVVAEPGVGKSRLCHEFGERCRAAGIEVYEAQALARGREIPFMPVLQMLRAYFGIGDDDAERIVREKIAGRTLLLDPELAEELPLLFDFLGVPDPERPLPKLSAEARQRALRDIVCRLAHAPARHEPMVILVEDLHWIDPGSEALLGGLLEDLSGSSLLAVVNFRPEYEPAWALPPEHCTIELQPLGPDDTRALLRDLAGEDPSLRDLAPVLHERTGGNPFFIEEIVRSLAEAGSLEGSRGAYRLTCPFEDSGVPAEVQTVLAARIDRLGPEAKRLLGAASVAGKEVAERALLRIAGLDRPEQAETPLRELIEAGFLFELELYPERVLAFRHPLTREVAYGSQLAGQRQAGHAAAAQALVELNPERHEELAALIASHLEQGDEPLEAARWSARAAYWAGHSRPREAMGLWQTVTRLADGLGTGEEPESMAVASRLQQLDFAWRVGMPREEQRRLEGGAEEIAERIGDTRSLALLQMLRSGRPGLEQRTAEWVDGIEQAVRLADESGDPHLRVALRAAGAYAYLCAGRLDRFEAALDEAEELAGGDRSLGAGIVIGSPLAWAAMGRGIAKRDRGEIDESQRLLERGVRIAEEDGDPETASWARSNLAVIQRLRNEPEAAVAAARRNCEQTERLGDVFSRSLALASLGSTLLGTEEYAAALEAHEEAERIYREAMGGGGEMEVWRAGLRAEALTGLGRAEEAAAVAEAAVGLAGERELHWSLPLASLALARARAAAGDHEGALATLDLTELAAGRIGAELIVATVEEERRDMAGERAG